MAVSLQNFECMTHERVEQTTQCTLVSNLSRIQEWFYTYPIDIQTALANKVADAQDHQRFLIPNPTLENIDAMEKTKNAAQAVWNYYNRMRQDRKDHNIPFCHPTDFLCLSPEMQLKLNQIFVTFQLIPFASQVPPIKQEHFRGKNFHELRMQKLRFYELYYINHSAEWTYLGKEVQDELFEATDRYDYRAFVSSNSLMSPCVNNHLREFYWSSISLS